MLSDIKQQEYITGNLLCFYVFLCFLTQAWLCLWRIAVEVERARTLSRSWANILLINRLKRIGCCFRKGLALYYLCLTTNVYCISQSKSKTSAKFWQRLKKKTTVVLIDSAYNFFLFFYWVEKDYGKAQLWPLEGTLLSRFCISGSITWEIVTNINETHD